MSSGSTTRPTLDHPVDRRLVLLAVRIGAVLGIVSAAAAGWAMAYAPRFVTGLQPWPVVAFVCAALVGGVAVLQAWWWHRPGKDWTPRLRQVSWWLHLGGYLAALGLMWAGLAVVIRVQGSTTAYTATIVAIAAGIGAVGLSGVNYVRDSGPSGLPHHHAQRISAAVAGRAAAKDAAFEAEQRRQWAAYEAEQSGSDRSEQS